jgi:trans-2,3-dihydro-3-hydroxyanthranilate isomerase
MPYRFVTADVFTSTMFGGNQLAVLPDARGLTGEQMLAITREFNYSESTFVLPPEHGGTRRVRIFTPGGEVPFAGHPTVGTAHVLAAIGEIPLAGAETRVVFEEGVGDVPVTIRASGGVPTFAQLSVAKLPEVVSATPDLDALAEVLSLRPDDFVGGPWAPVAVTCGLPFLMVAVKTRDAVRRARVRMEPWERLLAGTPASEPMVFALDAEGPGVDVRARVFVPGLSVPEDPATGSACAALGGFLALRTPRDGGTLRWVVEQGIEMGRPSRLEIEVDKAAGAVTAVRVGGSSVLVSEGTVRVRGEG